MVGERHGKRVVVGQGAQPATGDQRDPPANLERPTEAEQIQAAHREPLPRPSPSWPALSAGWPHSFPAACDAPPKTHRASAAARRHAAPPLQPPRGASWEQVPRAGVVPDRESFVVEGRESMGEGQGGVSENDATQQAAHGALSLNGSIVSTTVVAPCGRICAPGALLSDGQVAVPTDSRARVTPVRPLRCTALGTVSIITTSVSSSDAAQRRSTAEVSAMGDLRRRTARHRWNSRL